MAVVCERALAYLRASLSSFTGSAGLWIGLTFWHWRGNLDFGQNGKDAAVNRVVAIFCRSPLECRSGIWCLGSVGRRQYRTGVVGVPSVYRICDLRGPDYHRSLGGRSLSLSPAAPALRLSVLPFGRLYLVPLVLCDCQWATECCRGKWCRSIGYSLVVFWLLVWFVAYAARTGRRLLLYSDHPRPAALQ